MRPPKFLLPGIAVSLLLLGPSCLRAEQLPLKHYTIADGLARDTVYAIMQDSSGFLWFCTSEGLSRFDGYTFSNYGVDQGLPGRELNQMIEAHDGSYWIASSEGLVRFNPRSAPAIQGSNAEPLFVTYRPGAQGGMQSAEASLAGHLDVLLEDRTGTIWCGSVGGLFKFSAAGPAPLFSRVPLSEAEETHNRRVSALVQDHSGAIWVGTENLGLIRLEINGKRTRMVMPGGPAFTHIGGIVEDRDRKIWVATAGGLVRFTGNGSTLVTPERVYTSRDGLPADFVGVVFQTSDGRIWVSCNGGVTEIDPHARSGGIRQYHVGLGQSDSNVLSYCEDHDGNLWLGSESSGVMKIASRGFVTYRETDGLSSGRIVGIGENRNGDLVVFGANAVNAFADRRFRATRFNLPDGWPHSWAWNQAEFQDHLGDWWVPTNRGVCRFGSDAHQSPLPQAKACLKFDEKGAVVFRLFEDSHGDIWISAFSKDSILARWNRATGEIERFHQIDPQEGATTAFREDRAGNLWTSPYNGGLVRIRDGRFTFFGAGDGVPRGFMRDLYLDHSGRLWLASTQGGVGRVDDPGAEHPRFVSLTTAEGLASNQATCFAEDKWGRIYIGTGRGVDQYDPATNHFKHFTTADGLADNFINVAFGDQHGDLWFGTLQGLSQFVPAPEPERTPPMIRIGALRIAGSPSKLPELGAGDVAAFDLQPDRNQLQIDFFSIGFTPGETLRYQYLLRGADRDWSPMTTGRSVNYSSLPPGSYSFLVRAINANGLVSQTPATVSFRVLPPFWRRWWFITIMVVFVAGTAVSVTRYRAAQMRERRLAEQALRRAREERLAELEQVRKRIATDLHDDIGSSLTRISLLSEVAQRQSADPARPQSAPLPVIAALSRELVDAMSDIVWAINPHKDSLGDLTQRMRRFAGDLFGARDIDVRFILPDAARQLRMGANFRRELLLIFKEAVNNAVRHSGCTAASVEFAVIAETISLRLTDNGHGFDLADQSQGHGLASMRERAAGLGGKLEIRSSPAQGTTLLITVPVGHHETIAGSDN